MTAAAIIQKHAGKPPAAILAALHAGGFAVVPTTYKMGLETVRVSHRARPPEEQWPDMVEFARVRA